MYTSSHAETLRSLRPGGDLPELCSLSLSSFAHEHRALVIAWKMSAT